MSHPVPANKEDFDALCQACACTLPYADDFSVLASPAEVGGKGVANRIVYQAMEGCDGTRDGVPDELTMRRYMRFADGGPGIVWFEATAVMNEGRANPRQMYLNDNTVDRFARIVSDIKERCMKTNGFEPLVLVQLTHSGRYSKPDGTPAPLIAYNNPVLEKDGALPASRILTDDALDVLSEKLVAGAKLAERAGFDGADIKSCHRYLLCELLSAYTRPGKYGGSYENRTRMLRQTISGAVQTCSRNFILSSRLNIYDGIPYPYGFGVREGNGLQPDYSEAIRLVRDLAGCGVKLLNFTMGNPYSNPHVNRPFVKGPYVPDEPPLRGVERMLTGIAEVSKAVPDGIPVISSGLSYLGGVSSHVAAACIEAGWYTFAGYGREVLAYPDTAKTICRGEELPADRLCITCSKCTEIMRAGGTPGCVIRDGEVYLPLYKQYVTKTRQEVTV